jgi:hypothetical protein
MTGQPRRPNRGPVFVIELQAPSDSDGIHTLRAILKVLLRRYGWRCTAAREEQSKEGVSENA